jgi:hypothetical protein
MFRKNDEMISPTRNIQQKKRANTSGDEKRRRDGGQKGGGGAKTRQQASEATRRRDEGEEMKTKTPFKGSTTLCYTGQCWCCGHGVVKPHNNRAYSLVNKT